MKNCRKRDISKGVNHAFFTFGEGILRNHFNETKCAKIQVFWGEKFCTLHKACSKCKKILPGLNYLDTLSFRYG